TWDEVEQCTRPEDLVFTSGEVLDRVAEHGDLLAPLTTAGEARGTPGQTGAAAALGGTATAPGLSPGCAKGGLRITRPAIPAPVTRTRRSVGSTMARRIFALLARRGGRR